SQKPLGLATEAALVVVPWPAGGVQVPLGIRLELLPAVGTTKPVDLPLVLQALRAQILGQLFVDLHAADGIYSHDQITPVHDSNCYRKRRRAGCWSRSWS